MRGLQLAVVFAVSVIGSGGCSTRSIREGTDALDGVREKAAASPRPGALGGVAVRGEDVVEPAGFGGLHLIPFVPYATAEQAGLRAHDLEPELERTLWPAFRNAPGDRRLLLRCTIERSRVRETRTLYGLSIVGGVLAAVVGAPLKFMEAEVSARIEVLDPGAPAGSAPLFATDVRGEAKARAGIAVLFYWYNTDVTPRDMTSEAWARALEQALAALPAKLPVVSPGGSQLPPGPPLGPARGPQ